MLNPKIIFLLATLLFLPTLTTFVSNVDITLLPSSTIFKYSFGNKYFASASAHRIQIVDGRTYALIQEIDLSVIDASISAIQFSRDSTLLAIGFNNGQTHLFNHTTPTQNIFSDTGLSYKSTIETTVSSLCINLDKSAIVIGFFRDQVTVWELQIDIKTTVNFDFKYVQSVSCAVSDPSVFVVGGGSSTASKLTVYSYLNRTISVVKNMPDDQNTVLQTIYGQQDKYIYTLNKKGQIKRISLEDWSISSVYTYTGVKLYQMQIFYNEMYIAVSFEDAKGVKISSLQFNGDSYKETQVFATDRVERFGFSSLGGHLMLVSQNGHVFGVCERGHFYDDLSNKCGQCSNCFCDLTADDCYACQKKYYLKDKKCQKCSIGCDECTDGETCSQCAPHFILKQGKCSCESGYYLSNQQCLKCQPGCLECTDRSHCTVCKEQFELKEGYCICPDGKFVDKDTCLDCGRGCQNCVDQKTCFACKTAQHYVNKDAVCVCDAAHHFVDDGTNCVCPEKYYEKEGECLACPLGCLTCTSDVECQSCNEGLELKDGVCKCINADEYLDQDGTCKRCSDTIKYCVQCSDAQHCQACQAGINRELKNDECDCIENYFPDSEDVCQVCTIHGCLECESLQVCKTCDTANFWEHDEITQKCRCIHNYTEYEDSCIKCAIGCAKCDPSECIDCDEYHHWVHNDVGQCKCNVSYYQKDEICQTCILGCALCDNPDTCTTCFDDFTLKDGICVCPEGTYASQDHCLPCGRGCSACDNEETCFVCKTAQHYVNKGGLCVCDGANHFVDDGTNCVCDQKYYEKEGQCFACPLGCLTCTSDVECQSCNEGLELKDGVCKCINADEYLDQDGTCKRCSDTMKYCIQCTDAQHCQACQAGINRELKNDECDCIENYFPDGDDVCQVCTIHGCLECESLSVCKTCDTANFWEHDEVSQKCRCIHNYTEYDDSCIKCAIGCAKCDPSECIDCDEYNHWVHNDVGQCECNISYYQNNQICSKCTTGCKVCDNPDTCTTCFDDFTLKDGVCLCPEGTYANEDKCLPCGRGCSLCESAQTCFACKIAEHYVNKDGLCVCDAVNHFVDDGTNCVCEEKYYQKDGVCLACPLGCLTCTSDVECQSCNEGLELKDGVCKCINADEYLDQDGTCKRCNDAIKYCIQCTDAQHCQACQAGINRELKNDECDCIDKYFPDADDVCQVCSIHGCLECESLNVCKTCDTANFWEHDEVSQKCRCIHNYTEYEDSCIKCAIGCAKCDPSECIDCDEYHHWVHNDVGQCECNATYFQSGQICSSCMNGCLNCLRADFCDVCDQQKHFQAKNGICTCQAGFYPQNSSCSSCSVIPHCLQCSSQQACTQCAPTFTISPTTHKCICPARKFQDKDKCSDCGAHCLTCTSATSCTTCEQGYKDKKGQCVKDHHIKRMGYIIAGVMFLAWLVFNLLK